MFDGTGGSNARRARIRGRAGAGVLPFRHALDQSLVARPRVDGRFTAKPVGEGCGPGRCSFPADVRAAATFIEELNIQDQQTGVMGTHVSVLVVIYGQSSVNKK